MYILNNYSHEYKTRRILDFDKILLNITCFSSCAIHTAPPHSTDASSAHTTPTQQVNNAHVNHFTPSPGGPTSAQMHSGLSTLLCQMILLLCALNHLLLMGPSQPISLGISIMFIKSTIQHIIIPMMSMRIIFSPLKVHLVTVVLMVVWPDLIHVSCQFNRNLAKVRFLGLVEAMSATKCN